MVIGLVIFAISFQIKSNAERAYSIGQCVTILGAVVGALYQPEAEACMNAHGLTGMITGGAIVVLGIILIAHWLRRKKRRLYKLRR